MAPPQHSWLQRQRARLALRRGLAHLRKGHDQAAIAALTQALIAHPHPGMVYRQRAMAYRHQEQWAAALADYERAIVVDPQDTVAYGSRGLLRYEQGDRDGAMADWDKALTLDPTNATVRYNRGLVYAQGRQLTAALGDLDAALAQNPLLAEAYLHRGQVRYDLGDTEGAIQDWELALRNDLRLEMAQERLLHLAQAARQETVCQHIAAALPPAITVGVETQGDKAVLSLHRPVGTPVNYFTLPQSLRPPLIALQLPQVRRFQILGRAGDASLAEWNQTYGLYDQLPCPAPRWRRVAAAVALCPPVGLVAVVYAAQVHPAHRRGDYPLALRLSQTVRGLCFSSGAIAVALLVGVMSYGIYRLEANPPTPPKALPAISPRPSPQPPMGITPISTCPDETLPPTSSSHRLPGWPPGSGVHWFVESQNS